MADYSSLQELLRHSQRSKTLFDGAEPGGSGDAAGTAAGHSYLRGTAKSVPVQEVSGKTALPNYTG